jgi:hydroxymethylbilane synthase
MANITLASRDSLLALAQTIDAAMRFKAAGFTPRIVSLKTAGDLKLAEPLYAVAQKVTEKEGRAFFTRELDDALMAGTADAAVHSLKDLPAEAVPGISAPVFFSEVTGADVLLLRDDFAIKQGGANLVIGTSSLRRIHQLGHVYPAATVVTLRGNIVTRLMKLCSADRGMNAILIAAAGIRRLKNFAALPGEDYRSFVSAELFEKIQGEIRRFSEFASSGIRHVPLAQKNFPTAPGQGVLAFQISDKARALLDIDPQQLFAEHSEISPRVSLERQMMTELQTGCHAPLGISAEQAKHPGIYAIHACFSRKSTLNPPAFSEPVFLSRYATDSVAGIAQEIRRPFATAFWWGGGLKKLPVAPDLNIHPIDAIRQTLDDDRQVNLKPENTGAVFVSSPAVFFWLKRNPAFVLKKLWAAGSETAAELKAVFPEADVDFLSNGGHAGHAADGSQRGFAPAYKTMRAQTTGKILWLGSQSGEARARKIAGADGQTEFLPVYDNIPVPVDELIRHYPLLADPLLVPKSIHLITSASAAAAFFELAKGEWHNRLKASCFGESAAEFLIQHGFTPYHLSEAGTFADYLKEIAGDISLMKPPAEV